MTLQGLIEGDLTRLRFVFRFSSVFVLHKESVAEHSFFVALYSYFIGKHVIDSGCKSSVDFEKLMTKALIHDIDECRTGDFLRTFKYSSPEVKLAIEVGASNQLHDLMTTIDVGAETKKEVMYEWQYAKDDSIEGRIVAFSDFIAVLSYMLQEINCSNFTMVTNHKEMMEYFGKFTGPNYNFIRELVDEAREMVLRLTPEEKK